MTELKVRSSDVQEEEKVQFITFLVNTHEYGVHIELIREIKGWMHPTSLPNTPSYVLGVVNLRGTVIPIYDLRARFGLGCVEISKTSVIMILTVDNKTMGLLVDAVCEIMTVASESIRPVPRLESTHTASDIFKGIVNLNERVIALLDMEKIFDASVEIDGIQLEDVQGKKE
jgi:purine-binding chemotaxis protein CheW